MKFIIAPDSFKGSLSASEFCCVTEDCIEKYFTQKNYSKPEIILMPLADGGEGTLDCILFASGGEKKSVEVTGPFFKDSVTAQIGFFSTDKKACSEERRRKIAVIETAQAMGLPVAGDRKNPLLTTTYGAGQMILSAIECGVQKIILTLGGSSTNDCGAGLLCALGARFFDSEGKDFIPTGGTLKNISSADFSGVEEKIRGVEITAMCDVNNPLCGTNGASCVYGPQKGASAEDVILLDEGCRNFARVTEEYFSLRFSDRTVPSSETPGAGAAGGLGYCCLVNLHGSLQSGIETILSLYDFDSKKQNADFIITGEGKFDEQSLMGKTIGGLMNHLGITEASSVSKNSSCLLKVFCGTDRCPKEKLPSEKKLSVTEISNGHPLEYSIAHGKELLAEAVTEWLNTAEL